jgi:hypothetical protein
VSRFECSIETCSFETGSPLGMTAHSRAHSHAFEEAFGRPPETFEEVRRWLNCGEVPDDVPVDGGIGRPTTVDEWREDA